MSDDETLKEVRAQRHDFIKEYYKMATADLDRHLKGGWQTIAVLAGGVAILAAGQEDKLGLPIAVSVALLAAIWGILTVIDSNYWSVRAIAFLSNVEAIYFSVEDRKYFNPYIGYHPKFKLMDSLKHMFVLCAGFGVLALLSLLWGIEITSSGPAGVIEWFWDLSPIAYFLWACPVLVAVWGIVWTFVTWRGRLSEYYDFVESCPGPGVRETIEPWRDVLLKGADGAVVGAEHPQTQFLTELDAQKRKQFWYVLAWLLALAVTAAFALRFIRPF